ncbi:hypothetical protein ACXR2U_23730 [Jatrophihabitans sp. YIM 134969]
MSTPAPRSPESPAGPDPDHGRGVSRRVLLGGGLLVLGGIGGGVAGFVATDAPREVVPDPVPPADVLAAIDRERRLLALYDYSEPNALFTSIRTEHQAHLDALTALLPSDSSPSPSGSESPIPPPPADRQAADLALAERDAAGAAKAACLAGNGTAAVLLACIAASEASHAAVLT